MPQTSNDPKVKSRQALAFGRWLRRRRHQLGEALRPLAHRAGVGYGSLSDLEQGHVDPLELPLRTVEKLTRGYRVQLPALLARLGLMPYPPDDIEGQTPPDLD